MFRKRVHEIVDAVWIIVAKIIPRATAVVYAPLQLYVEVRDTPKEVT